jgi:hypothetical protein
MFVVPLDSRIARYAGYLRRLHRFKTPDSAIATTAIRTKTTPHLSGIAARVSPWYDGNMDTTPFELTPEQKGMLASLSRETGKAIPALIAQALEELQEHVHAQQGNGETQGGDADQAVPPSQQTAKPIWEQFIEASLTIPDEELDRLPIDGATQHDHYIYGTRSVRYEASICQCLLLDCVTESTRCVVQPGDGVQPRHGDTTVIDH